jgi:ABC-type amino acid transport system permease subunit
MEVRSIQLYSFVAAVFFVVCFVGSRISRHYETKSRKANIL